MNEIAQIAQEAIDALRPMLHEIEPFASKALGGFAGPAGAKLFAWLTDQVKGKPAQATLERAVTEPDNARRVEALRLEIEDLAERDPNFRQQLADLLKGEKGPAGSTTGTQTATAEGGSKIVQNIGKGNSIQIG